MRLRLGIALGICLCVASQATAQVVRFETTMGDFDMVLNPTKNPLLQGHVNNMLDYVERESYKGSWINRAAEGFVLQMGQFFSLTERPPITEDMVRRVRQFQPVKGVPAAPNGFHNTIGTVALGLSAPTGVTDPDTGSASFFVNVADNSNRKNLEDTFTVFAAIPDSGMKVIDKIMGLSQIDKRQDFGSDPDDPTYQDIPIQADGYQVFIKRAFVLTDALEIARITSDAQSVMTQSAQSIVDSSTAPLLTTSAAAASTAPALSSNNVPEPATLTMVLASLLGLGSFTRRRRCV